MGRKQLLRLVLAVAVAAGVAVFYHYAGRAASDAEAGADVSGAIERAHGA